jgi:hypothetical protein
MSTKDTLINVGLLAAGGVAVAAASGVYGKGSRNKNHQRSWTGLRVNFSKHSGTDGDTVSMAFKSLTGLAVELVPIGGSKASDVEILGITQSSKSPYLVRLEYRELNHDGEMTGPKKSIALDLIDHINVL